MAKFFLYIGVIAMVLSGGCSLWAMDQVENSQYVNFEDVLLLGGVPFVVGLVVFLLARRSLNKNS